MNTRTLYSKQSWKIAKARNKETQTLQPNKGNPGIPYAISLTIIKAQYKLKLET